jgi:MutS domain V
MAHTLPITEPRQEYSRRVEARLSEAANHFGSFRRVGVVRLAFLGTALLLIVGFLVYGLAWWWALIPLLGFIALAPVQQQIEETRRRCDRAARLYLQGIERLDDRWAGKGPTGERFLAGHHPYKEDLDFFGPGSLFELLSAARTQVGEETLASWLLAPAPREEVLLRQAGVAELRSKLDLREDLALLGAGVHTGAEALALTTWASDPPWPISVGMKWTARVLAGLGVVGLVLWLVGFGWLPFLVALLLGQVFAFWLRQPVQHVTQSVDVPGKDLQLLVEVLARFERESFSSPLLQQLRAELDVAGLAPSLQISKLKRLIELLDSRRNLFFAPFAAILLWQVQCAFAIESWRQSSGPAIARWLAAVGKLEALSSFARYSFEHPNDPFPELVEGEVLFDGKELGHPLLPESQNVRTDLHLSNRPSVLIVSGSNMSGKSTLLRTIGTNAVLALAGAPVRARSLRLAPVQVGASIRIQDSLQAGASRFYAEITRLREIVELCNGPLPVLFLLDEILHGTNSHDRKIGAEGLVKGLIARGAIGLVTTHDLALTQIAEELGPRVANVHFEDHLEGGKMTFDYLLRPGILQKSNALELMRSVGLDV